MRTLKHIISGFSLFLYSFSPFLGFSVSLCYPFQRRYFGQPSQISSRTRWRVRRELKCVFIIRLNSVAATKFWSNLVSGIGITFGYCLFISSHYEKWNILNKVNLVSKCIQYSLNDGKCVICFPENPGLKVKNRLFPKSVTPDSLDSIDESFFTLIHRNPIAIWVSCGEPFLSPCGKFFVLAFFHMSTWRERSECTRKWINCV